MNSSPLYQPREMFGRLALPSPKDLDLLLQDAMKPATSVKPLSHRVSVPAFPCSHNFNGHCKSNCDATKTSNKSSCQGRWVRVRSNASFTEEGDTDGYLDLDSLTYDETLIPAGQLKYELPEIEKKPSTLPNHPGYNQDSSSAMGALSSLPPHGKRKGFLKAAGWSMSFSRLFFISVKSTLTLFFGLICDYINDVGRMWKHVGFQNEWYVANFL